MGQQEVIEFLEKQKEPVASRTIAEELEVSCDRVKHAIKTLIKNKEVCFIELDHVKARKKYGLKRRCREYYVKK